MPSLNCRPSLRATASQSGFSLIELLTVMSIIAILSVGAVPAMNGIRGGQSLTKSAYDVAGVLEQARAYAMARNTYVYVGLAEASDTASDVQLTPGGGRLLVGVMASKSGVRPLSSDELIPMSRLQKYENLKLDTLGTDGNMARQTGSDVVSFADASATGFAGFTWNGAGGASVAFSKVIEFDPTGVARFTKKDNIDAWIEIPLKPARSNGGDVAALQVDGVTGVVRIYRP